MIPKQDLKGKKVSFRDKDGKYRICRVYKINGNTLTVGTVYKKMRLHWERIHPDKNEIFGVYVRNKVVEIDWDAKNNKH